MGSTLAVLVHYDPHGQVAEHVKYGLRRLRAVADRLVFVTAGSLAAGERESVALADEIVERPNTGYDFSSWRAGLATVPEWWEYDRVVLANDSIVGPLCPVADLFARQDAVGAQAFGITLSPQFATHLQSYYMSFTRDLTADPYFRAFWAGMPAIDDRELVIDAYELGLGRLLTDLGARLGAYFEPSPLDRRVGTSRSLRTFARRRPLLAAGYGLARPGGFSPIHMLWDRALTGALPAVKVTHFTQPLWGPERLPRDLQRLSAAYPEAFAGFDAYLRRVGREV